MISLKLNAFTGLCWLLALPFAFSQSTQEPAIPKWEFGLRSGAGFNIQHFSTQFVQNSPGLVFINRSTSDAVHHSEYYLGGFATLNLSNRWSIRSEMSLYHDFSGSSAIGVGLFPRYALTKWLSLEAGLESRQPLSGFPQNNSKIWLGTALKLKNVELNLRLSPSYTPSSGFVKGGWSNAIQVGMGFNLGKKGRVGLK